MHTNIFITSYLYVRISGLECGGLEWSYSFPVDSPDCFIKIYYMILYNKCFLLTSYDITRTLQEQLNTQEQRNNYQTDQLTFRDARLDITYGCVQASHTHS